MLYRTIPSKAARYIGMAYTMELEAEVAKLKEQNQELQEKQVVFSTVLTCLIYDIMISLTSDEPLQLFVGRNDGDAEKSVNVLGALRLRNKILNVWFMPY
ncbi:hypothetical protein BHM03_00034736 [Ensete ventricosum]|nr:hypothetical protein BHM03_00034736 [Ensete ventricosum]